MLEFVGDEELLVGPGLGLAVGLNDGTLVVLSVDPKVVVLADNRVRVSQP